MNSAKFKYLRFFCPLFVMLLAALIAGSGFCQDEPEFGVLPHSTPEGMLLIIFGDILHPDNANLNDNWTGYHIYKKSSGDTDFIRLTEKPQSRVGSINELESMLGIDIDGLATFADLENKDQLWRAIVENQESLGFLSMLLRPFKMAMGQLVWDHDVIDGEEYEYYITRVDLDNAESDPSASITMPYGTPPIPLLGPIDVELEQKDNDVNLSWRPNPADSGAFSYSVYRSEDPEGTFLRLNMEPLLILGDPEEDPDNNKGGFTDTTVVAGRQYYYAVVSEDYGGNKSPQSPYLEFETRDTDPPSIPQNVFANSAELGLEIIWETVIDEDVAGYSVYRSDDADTGYTKLNQLILPRTPGAYVDRSVGISDRYFYRVSSIDRSGNESRLSPRAVYLYQSPRPPLPPQNVQAETQTNAVHISWISNEERNVRGYYVYRADRHGGELSQVSPLIGGDTTSYIDEDEYLSARGRYYYVVQAMNYSGLYGPYSLPAVASPQTDVGPDAPLSFYGYRESIGNRLIWRPPDNNMIAGYNVYRAVDSDSLEWVKLTDTAVHRTTGEYFDLSAKASVPYLYHLKAVNDDGIEGGQSHLVSLTQFSSAPIALSGVRVERTESGLRVVWSESLDGTITGYRVYRRMEGQSAVLIHEGSSSSQVTYFSDDDVNSFTRYYYSVSAVAEDGQEGFRSAEVEYYVD